MNRLYKLMVLSVFSIIIATGSDAAVFAQENQPFDKLRVDTERPAFGGPSKYQTPTLDEFIQEALTNNPDLEAARKKWEAAQSRVPQASALPNPMAGYSYMGADLETPLGPQETLYEFEQEIPFPGKLLEKRRMAAAEAKATEAQYKLMERELIFNVSQTYYDFFAVDRSIALMEQVKELLMKFESIARAQYASLKGAQSDVARAQSEVSMVLEQLFMLRQQRETLVAYLNALLNRKNSVSIESLSDPNLPEASHALEELLDLLKQSSPELLEAMAMKLREEHAYRLAKYEYVPDFSVGFQYIGIGDGMTTEPDDGRDAWMIPVKVTLPIWQNRIGPGVKEARSNLQSSEAKLDNTKNLTEYELRRAFYEFTTQKKVVELYQNAFIPQAEIAFRSNQAGYEAGTTDILNLLDTERVYLNAHVTYYQALANALKSHAMMEKVIGKSLNDTLKPPLPETKEVK